MITTEKIQLTSLDLFKILLITYFKKKWWLFLLIWAMGASLFLDSRNDSFADFFVVFAISYPIYFLIFYWRYANSKDNKIFLLERYYGISEDKIVGILDDGTESPIKLEHFIKVVELKKFYLLYISKSQFIYIPKDSFKSESDKEWFVKEIVKRIGKNI